MSSYEQDLGFPHGWRRHLSSNIPPPNGDPAWSEWYAAWQLDIAIRRFEEPRNDTTWNGVTIAARHLRNSPNLMPAPTVPSAAGMGMNNTTAAIDPQLLGQAPPALGIAGPVNAGPVNAGPGTAGVAPGQPGPMVPASTGTAHPRKGAPWTKEEKYELPRRPDAGESYQTIARALGRTRWACESKGSHLHVYKGC
ncbi:hypothetical protein VMCG_10656 [Cytospora schulzeri]|uniref:Myb-like domain-containing protein n=1 Tax=Cytospora schulzeri TaxID=448051 RepID=A0A423V8L4_9PEZI|nr:hypothetical protein VMCG_10656 [Valsa malicola]